MFQTNLWCYLWDLVDEGIDEVLDRLKGEAGVAGISVATCYHSVDQLRPRPSVWPKRFRSPGGAQFQPQSGLYSGTRIRPVVAQWLKKSNPLAAVAEACAKRGLILRGWNVCCHSSLMVQRYPSAAVKNVLEIPETNWLCLVNPDVREYLRAMVEDLSSNYPFETIELERPTFQYRPHSHAHVKVGFELGELGQWLTNLCFCESCRQQAQGDGLDVADAARIARSTLEQIFAIGEPLDQTLEEFVADHRAIASLVDWRCAQVASLIASIKQASRCRLVVHRDGDQYMTAFDFSAIAANCDGLLLQCPHERRDGVVAGEVKKAAAETGDIGKIELGFNACTPPCPDSATLVKSLKSAATSGVRGANIYNYGLLPPARLEWIQQAARYAQREAD